MKSKYSIRSGTAGSKKSIDATKAFEIFAEAPVIIGFLRGEDYIIEFANNDLLAVWKVGDEVHGQSLFKVFPELEDQGFRKLLDDVRITGKPFHAFEFPITFIRGKVSETSYFDFIYKAVRENGKIAGVIAVGHDVSERVVARKRIEAEEKKWRELSNTIPVIVWTADDSGNVEFFNEAWYELTGYTKEQSLGFGWATAIHPDDLPRCMELWQDARERRTFYQTEVRYRGKDGNYTWILARGIPVLQDNVVTAWYGTSTDISAQKDIESRLEAKVRGQTKEVEEKTILLDNILKNSTNGISVSRLIFDDAGKVVDAQTVLANDAAVNFIGIPKDLYLTKPASFFDPNIIASPYGQACISTAKTGEPFIMRYFLEFSKRWLELTVSKMDESHLIHHFTDVTSIKEAEIKLEKTMEDLRYSNANLEEFAYAASHDLKEPIRKLNHFSSRLKNELNDKLDERQRAIFEKLESTQLRMDKLIDDLLEYSQAAKGSVEREDIDLNETLNSVVEDLELEIQKKHATLEIDKLPTIKGNKRQIHQLFQNLVSNSLKYSNPDVDLRITIKSSEVRRQDVPAKVAVKQEGIYHLIEIRDTGIGFEQEYADQIFKVFTRLHSNDKYQGSGIGLAIVKKVVESHDGFIWAEGEESKGAVFKVLLPKQ